jgi:hypothetical protein
MASVRAANTSRLFFSHKLPQICPTSFCIDHQGANLAVGGKTLSAAVVKEIDFYIVTSSQ